MREYCGSGVEGRWAESCSVAGTEEFELNEGPGAKFSKGGQLVADLCAGMFLEAKLCMRLPKHQLL